MRAATASSGVRAGRGDGDVLAAGGAEAHHPEHALGVGGVAARGDRHRRGEPAGRHGERPGRAGVQVAGQGDPTCSQLAGMTCLLGRGGDRLDVAARGGGDRRGDRALDERRVGEQHALGVAVSSSTARTVSTALPRSGSTTTPAPLSASLSPRSTLAALVPSSPSSVPPGRDDRHRAAADLARPGAPRPRRVRRCARRGRFRRAWHRGHGIS